MRACVRAVTAVFTHSAGVHLVLSVASAVLGVRCRHAQSLSRVQLCYSMDRGPPGSSVRGVSQARILEGLPFPPPGVERRKVYVR